MRRRELGPKARRRTSRAKTKGFSFLWSAVVIILGLSVAGFFLLLTLTGSNDDEAVPSSTTSSTASQHRSLAPIAITAIALYAAYEENEIAADRKYKGRVVHVEGEIVDIGRDIVGEMYVALKTGALIGCVQCMFKEQHESALASLRKGQWVVLGGRCDGKLINILVANCAVWSADPQGPLPPP